MSAEHACVWWHGCICSTSLCYVATPEHMLPSSRRLLGRAYIDACFACTLIASDLDLVQAA